MIERIEQTLPWLALNLAMTAATGRISVVAIVWTIAWTAFGPSGQ